MPHANCPSNNTSESTSQHLSEHKSNYYMSQPLSGYVRALVKRQAENKVKQHVKTFFINVITKFKLHSKRSVNYFVRIYSVCQNTLIRTCLELHVHEYLDSILSQHICQSNVDHVRISSNFPGKMKHSKATPTRLCLAQHLRIDPLHFGTTHWDLVDFTPSHNMAGLGVSQLQLPSGNLLHSYWKWPLIVDFPITNGDFP